ncbi:MAG: hypothetical protein AAF752_13040, partial [Bacteroidota bacterium]
KPKDADLLNAALAEDAPRIALLAATLAAPVEAFMESATNDVEEDAGAEEPRGSGTEELKGLGAQEKKVSGDQDDSEEIRDRAGSGHDAADPSTSQPPSPSALKPLNHPATQPPPSAYSVFDLARVVQDEAREAQTAGGDAYEASTLAEALLHMTDIERADADDYLDAIVDHPGLVSFLKINTFDGVRWYNKERFDLLLAGLRLRAALSAQLDPNAKSARAKTKRYLAAVAPLDALGEAHTEAGYKIDALIDLVGDPA